AEPLQRLLAAVELGRVAELLGQLGGGGFDGEVGRRVVGRFGRRRGGEGRQRANVDQPTKRHSLDLRWLGCGRQADRSGCSSRGVGSLNRNRGAGNPKWVGRGRKVPRNVQTGRVFGIAARMRVGAPRGEGGVTSTG